MPGIQFNFRQLNRFQKKKKKNLVNGEFINKQTQKKKQKKKKNGSDKTVFNLNLNMKRDKQSGKHDKMVQRMSKDPIRVKSIETNGSQMAARSVLYSALVLKQLSTGKAICNRVLL